SATKLPVPFVYYLLLPTLLGFRVVGMQCLATRELGGGHVVAFAMVLIALLSWGDHHHSYGNFAFVRLFQGKAALVSFFVPPILYYVCRYARAPSFHTWTLLALTQVAAIGFSCNALVVAPLSATIFLVASLRRSGTPLKYAGLGLLASAYPVLILLVASISTHGWEGSWAIFSDGLMRAIALSQTNAGVATQAGLHDVLGGGLRGYLALLSVLGLTAIPLRSGSPISGARLALATLAIPLNPFAAELL